MWTFKPRVIFQGKSYFFDYEQNKWFTDTGQEVPENVAMKLHGKFTDLRREI